jgi:hypothetical protein
MSQFTVQQILNFKSISQYLAANDESSLTQLKSGSIIGNLPGLLYMEGYLLQNLFSLNPGGATVRPTAEYVLSLCGKYLTQAQTITTNLSGSLPVLTGPANQSGLVGFTANFSVSVSGTGPFQYQWFRNNVLVPGATSASISVPNAQLSDTGSTFFVQVTNAAGSPVSGTATLTVTANLVGQWYAGGTDYSTLLAAGTDSVAYSGTFSITDGQPLVVPYPAGQLDFIVCKFPVSQSQKTHYANPAAGLDQGTVPGLALDINTFGGNNYIFSRTGNMFGINNISGQVTFS